MQSTTQDWLVCLISISAVWLYLLIRKGPVAALGAAVVLSFLFPVWLKVYPGGAPINIRTAVACITMLGFAIHPQSKILSSLTSLDAAMALMLLTHVVSDSFATGLTPLLPFRAYGEWVLPYIAGRYAVSRRDDLKWIATWVVGVLLFLGLMSCIESLTNVNPFEFLFGNRSTELNVRSATRFGLRRALGPTTHPIFFGMIIAMLMPWLACMWQSFDSRRVRGFTVFVGIIAFAGAVFSGSRTPVLTILGATCLSIAIKVRGFRWPLGVLFVVAICGFAAFPNEVVDAISRWTGGGARPIVIEVDGKAVVSSSSRSRLHYLGIYSDALIKAGPFGYGTTATTGFPLRIPGMEGTFKSSNLFEMVDNGYILLTLRFGWMGGLCLILLFLTAIATGLALFLDRPDQLFPGVIACTLVVVAFFSLLLVFMNYDFGLPILWTMGILSGLSSTRTRQHTISRPVRS